MNKRGFTSIEIMIVIAIIGILVSIIAPFVSGDKGQGGKVSWGYNGATEERCISGYKFIVGPDGRTVQMLGENGAGIKCDIETQPSLGPAQIK